MKLFPPHKKSSSLTIGKNAINSNQPSSINPIELCNDETIVLNDYSLKFILDSEKVTKGIVKRKKSYETI